MLFSYNEKKYTTFMEACRYGKIKQCERIKIIFSKMLCSNIGELGSVLGARRGRDGGLCRRKSRGKPYAGRRPAKL